MNFIEKIIDIPKLIRRLWDILWITEILLVAMKFCFNIWYPIIIENENVLKICNVIDNNYILNYAILLMLYLINENIQYLTCIKKIKYKNYIYLLVFNGIFVANYFLKMIKIYQIFLYIDIYLYFFL